LRPREADKVARWIWMLVIVLVVVTVVGAIGFMLWLQAISAGNVIVPAGGLIAAFGTNRKSPNF